jgi:putative acetyltransferase
VADAAPRSVRIRPELVGDAAGIRLVLDAAFPGPAEGRLVDALRVSGRLWVSEVAEAGRAIVGHVAFTAVSVAGAADGMGLAPLAVRPDFQRRGVGASLVRAGLETCRRAGAGFVVVVGEPAYYGRFGFTAAAGWGLSDEYGGGAAFQALELRPGAIPRGAGRVRYAPEFAALADAAG